jgi:hypothetical protein
VLLASGEPILSLNLLFASLSFSRIRKVTPKDFRIWDFRDAFPFLRDIMRFSRSSGLISEGMLAKAVWYRSSTSSRAALRAANLAGSSSEGDCRKLPSRGDPDDPCLATFGV